MLIIYRVRLRQVVLGGRYYETKHGGKSDQDGGEAEKVILLVYEMSLRTLFTTTRVRVPST